MSEKLEPKDYLGMEVVVSVGDITEWHGTAIAFRDEPSVMIQTEGGLRMMLPANRVRLAYPLPKPWHDAKPGEVWVLTVDGKEDAFKLHGDLFRTGNLHDIEQTDRHITAGRRIWPEVVES